MDENLSAPGGAAADALPEIGKDFGFRFECGPESACYNRCCADVSIPLTPYDAARIRRNLNIPSGDFLAAFTEMSVMPETGLSLPSLKMLESPDAPCPFVGPPGCSIYEDRPGACRSWPVGRGSSVSADGIKERYFLIKEEYCQGFCAGKKYTPLEWQLSQGMEPYNRFNDRYMTLLSKIAAGGEPLDSRRASMCFLALYQLDRFRELIEKMRIFGRLEIDPGRQVKIMEDSAEGDEVCLDFALQWLELTLFGSSEGLRKKD